MLAAPPADDPRAVELAQRYAFAFFFRRMIPFRHVGPTGAPDSAPGVGGRAAHAGRDPCSTCMCDRILDGEELIVPDALALG